MRVLMGMILATACCAASAGDPKTDAATRLVEMMQINEMYGVMKSVCIAAADARAQANASYTANPELFGGITPRSAYWSDVVGLFNRYREEICTHDPAAAKRAYVKMYLERLSLSELQAALAYQDSAVGRAVQSANRDTVRAVSTLQSQEQQQAMASAGQRYTTGLAELVARYKAQPR